MTTATVEITIASHAGQIASKKIGSASIAIAFDRSNVDKSKWWSFMTTLIDAALIQSNKRIYTPDGELTFENVNKL